MRGAGIDAGYWEVIGYGAAAIVLYTIVGVLLAILGFFIVDWTTPGPLRTLVQAGRPNAAAVAAASTLSTSFIVIVAIYASSGNLVQGLITTAVFGLLGLSAQALALRLIHAVTGVDMGAVLAAERFTPEVLVVVAADIAFGLIIAIAIL